jgi:hypothetical protein
VKDELFIKFKYRFAEAATTDIALATRTAKAESISTKSEESVSDGNRRILMG